jgi:hypothetical protein
MATKKTAKKVVKTGTKFNSALAALLTAEAEGAAVTLLSPICANDWVALKLAAVDQDGVNRLLEEKKYVEAAAAIETAVKKATKKEATMKKKVTKTAPEAAAKKPAKKAAAKKPAAEAAKPAEKKAPAKLSRYGHRVGTSAEFMDNLLFQGCLPDAGAEAISAKYGMDVAKAKAKLLVHVRYLKKERDVAFATWKDKTNNKIKAKTAKIVWPKAK